MKEKWTKETGPMTYLDIFSSHFENLLNIIRKPWIGKENDPEVHDVFALEAVSRCNIRIQNGKKLFAWILLHSVLLPLRIVYRTAFT